MREVDELDDAVDQRVTECNQRNDRAICHSNEQDLECQLRALPGKKESCNQRDHEQPRCAHFTLAWLFHKMTRAECKYFRTHQSIARY